MRFAICFPGFPFSSVQTLSLWLMSPFAMPRRKLLFRARPRRTTFRVGPQPPCSPGREANLIPLRQRMDGCIAPFRIALLIDETVFDQKKKPTEKSALATQPNHPQSQLQTSPQGLQGQTRFPSGSSTGSDKTKQAYRHCSFSERQDGNYEPNRRFYRNGAFDIPFRRWVKQLCQ